MCSRKINFCTLRVSLLWRKARIYNERGLFGRSRGKAPAAKGHWRSGSKLAIRPIAGSKEVCGRSVAILRAVFHFVYNSYLEF